MIVGTCFKFLSPTTVWICHSLLSGSRTGRSVAGFATEDEIFKFSPFDQPRRRQQKRSEGGRPSRVRGRNVGLRRRSPGTSHDSPAVSGLTAEESEDGGDVAFVRGVNHRRLREVTEAGGLLGVPAAAG